MKTRQAYIVPMIMAMTIEDDNIIQTSGPNRTERFQKSAGSWDTKENNYIDFSQEIDW